MSSSEESSPSRQPKAALTPLAARLILALRNLAEDHDELQMIVRGFEKHLRKHPISDDDIRDGLGSIKAHIDAVLEPRKIETLPELPGELVEA